MAARAAARVIDQSEIETQFRSAGPSGTFFHFVATSEAGENLWRAAIYVTRLRAMGFMFALPGTEEVVAYFEPGGGAPEELFVFMQCEVDMETPRGRALGPGSVILVDCGWAGLDYFKRPARTEGGGLVRFTAGGTVGRPMRAPLEEAAENWVRDAMDEDTAAEYVTGSGGQEILPGEHDGEPLDGAIASQLLQRLEELERALGQRSQAVPTAPPDPQPTVPGGLLGPDLGGRPGDAAALERLQLLAGAAPTRLGGHERSARASRPEMSALAETQAEAVEAAEFDQSLEEALQITEDPMQKLLVMQMKQMAMLAKSFNKPMDPIQAALNSGGSDSSGGSTSGIKGCLARDAFVKVAEDLHKLAAVAEHNAVMELGLARQQVGPGLMRDYIEKRVPLGSYRLLTQVAYLAASGWEVGSRTDNKELQGFCAKLLMFVEQTALDQGRTGLSWLMTGLAEPNFAQTQANTVRAGVKPFTRLASPSWVAANVSYLRDLDFLETKIRAGGKADRVAPDKASEDKPKPTKKFGKGKQKGDRADSKPSASADAGAAAG